MPGAPWWVTPLPDLLQEVAASPAGLTSAEARARLRRYGQNRFRSEGERSRVRDFLRRFGNPLVLILIAASVVAALAGEVASFVIISIMVLASVILDFVQEYRASRAAQRLRQSVQVRASVLRNGTPQDVTLAHVVPGDVVLLRAGSLIPADGRLLEAQHLFVNQALLTGESFPVEKHAGDLHRDATELQHAANAVFMGTSIVSGAGRFLVCGTGANTAIAGIAALLSREPPPTASEIGLRQFGLLIMRVTVLMVLFVLLVNTATHKPLLESFLFAIALAVGLTPELLPMIVSVTLAHGALRMSRQHVIVKRLPAIQNLGSMDVLCTDKTGTLTEARISLERHVDAAGRDSPRVLTLACLNSHFETGIRSPLDDAILAHEHVDVRGWTKIDEAPFDFDRRRVSVLIDDGKARRLVVKGAPEDVLRLSTSCMTHEGTTVAFTPASRADAQRTLAALGDAGLRVLGIAFKDVGREHVHAEVGDEAALVFAGYAAFLDPPKATAAKALAALMAAGIAVKIVTGDNERTTEYVCRRLGVKITGVLTGAEIDHLSEAALRVRVAQVNLFCRVTPRQKNRIILALKAHGHVVGYLGDGVNDAPALQTADVGISVDTAVDVAKEAADLILLKHDLQVLHVGVIEGRRTFANIRKYIMMGTSSNFGNMLSMAAAALFLPFLPMSPGQVLLNNVLYDFSEVAIPLDRVDEDEVRGPQQWDMRFIRDSMWVLGPVSTVFDLLTFYVLLTFVHAGAALFQTLWFVESLASQVLVIFVIRTRASPVASRAHPALLATAAGVLVVALTLVAVPAGGYLGFVPPTARQLAIVAALVLAYLVIVECAKRVFYAHFKAT